MEKTKKSGPSKSPEQISHELTHTEQQLHRQHGSVRGLLHVYYAFQFSETPKYIRQ